MAEWNAEIAADVVAACNAGADEAGQALGRALDMPMTLAVGETAPLDPAAPNDDWNGPGLAITLSVGSSGAVLLLAESTGLLPSWYQTPDATGESKLATLAQELGMLLLPEAFMPEKYQAKAVPNLAEAIARADATDGVVLPLTLSAEGKTGAMTLIWPAAKIGEVYPAASSGETPADEASRENESAGESSPSSGAPAHRNRNDWDDLPNYTRSLLRIEVPIQVTLAEKRQKVEDVISLGPGSIIQFNKLCDDLLHLEVGGQRIAQGEAVKVGDKFGLRIAAIVLPEERFKQVRAKRA
jgi:flagellar motor switch/type III secretory pathway protein FliN